METVTAATAGKATEESSLELVKATSDFKCELCDITFENKVNLRSHDARQQKVTSSPIPQIDGSVILILLANLFFARFVRNVLKNGNKPGHKLPCYEQS